MGKDKNKNDTRKLIFDTLVSWAVNKDKSKRKLRVLIILIAYLIGYITSFLFYVDRIVVREIFILLAYGYIILLAVYPLIYFQILSLLYSKGHCNETLRELLEFFKSQVFTTLILLIIQITFIGTLGIMRTGTVFFSVIISVLFYANIIVLGLIKILNVLSIIEKPED